MQLYTIVTLVYDARAQELKREDLKVRYVIKSCVLIARAMLFYKSICPIFDTVLFYQASYFFIALTCQTRPQSTICRVTTSRK